METTGSGILGRLSEKALGWIILGLLIALGIAIWQMDPVLRTSIWQGIWRTIFWLALAAALPWSARFFIRRILATGTNWAGVGLLAAFFIVDVGAGLLMLGGCDATIEARRVAVAEDSQADRTPEETALTEVGGQASVGEAVRHKLADVVEGAAKLADNAAERLRSEKGGEAEADTLGAEVEAAKQSQESDRGGWFWFTACAALALAGTYNYLVTEYLSEMAGG